MLSGLMSNLAMSVPGLPPVCQLTQLSRDHAADLTDLVRARGTFFQRSETNTKEILGTLSAPNSTGLAGPPASGTTGACYLCSPSTVCSTSGAVPGSVHQSARPNRRGLATTLLTAGERYGQTLPAPDDAYLKVESFGGDREIRRLWPNAGCERHRVFADARGTSSARLHGPDRSLASV